VSGREEPPLFAGSVHGLRTWGVIGWHGEPRLAAAFDGSRWSAGGQPTRAACSARGGHPAPAGGCSCGLYALHPRPDSAHEIVSELEGQFDGGTCLGLVEAWGRVEVHADGFRAERARPLALLLLSSQRGSGYEATVRRLALAHRADVIEIGDAGDLLRHCRERGLGLSPEAVGDLLGDEPGDPPAEVPAPAPTPGPPTSRLGGMVARAGEAAAMILAVLLGIAWYGGLAFAGIAILIDILNGTESRIPAGPPRPPPGLELLDTRVDRFHGGLLHVTRVRNSSDERARVEVGLDGRVVAADATVVARLSGRATDQLRPTIAPNSTGAIVGWVAPTPSREEALERGGGRLAIRGESLRVRGGSVEAEGMPQVTLKAPRFDPAACTISAAVSSARALPAIRTTLVIASDGRLLGVDRGQAGPLGPERVRQVLTRVPPEPCADGFGDGAAIEVYPDPSRRQLGQIRDGRRD
jgi:hypothetical protein